MADKVALLTAVYQNYQVLEDFFKSLRKQTNDNYHLFIADASRDKQSISYEYVPFTLTHIKNLGYAHAINVGLQNAIRQGYTQFCVLNNDIYFEKDFIENVIETIRIHPKSLIGGKIYYAPGYEYHTDRYTKADLGNVIWYAGGQVDWRHATTHHRGVDEVDKGQFNHRNETGFITGCLMCFNKEVVDTIGYWDEGYFLYYEDSDYCERAKLKKLPLFYDPSLMIWHKNSQSTGGSGSSLHDRYLRKNKLRFGLKYAPWRTKFHLLKNSLFGR